MKTKSKYPQFHANVMLLAGAAILSALPACSTATKLGGLIPRHPNSEILKGETVTIGYAGKNRADQTGTGKSAVVGGALIAALAGWGIDAVKSELDDEAERYEHQHSGQACFTTNELGDKGALLYVRWTKSSNRTEEAFDLGAIADQVAPNDLASSADVRAELESMRPDQDKVPQMVLSMGMKTVGSKSVYRLEQPKLWVAGVGAKVVGFNNSEFWSWLGALALKVGNEAAMDIQMSVKALAIKDKSEVGGEPHAGWVEVEPSNPIFTGLKVDLSAEPPKLYKPGPRSGSWMPIPTLNGLGYIVVKITVTERDPSNVRKKIEKASGYIEKKKEGWIGSLTKAVTGG
ncbi:MAG: hypothetical protein JNN17_18465 [Verrucomicrobiaceae bacterium]|nr:hypothetical protein [Verrucomicrobiaceae bacterium]